MQTHSTVKNTEGSFFKQNPSVRQWFQWCNQNRKESLCCFIVLFGFWGPVLTCDNISICKYISLRVIQKSDYDEFNRKNIPLNLLSFSIMSDHYRIAPLNYLSWAVQQLLAKFIIFYQRPINAQSGFNRNVITEKFNNWSIPVRNLRVFK